MRIDRSFRRAVTGAALLLCGAMASAQGGAKPITVHVDPQRTEIHWTLGGMLHKIHGTFKLKGGVVTYDPATGSAAGEMLVDLDSGESGNASRDRLMKKNVLQSDTYPEAIFHPEKVSGALKPGLTQQMAVDGTFTIHGKDHPMRLLLQVQATGNAGMSATTHFTVPYVAWGMKDPSTFVLRVGKQVSVDVTARGTVEGLE